MTLPPPPPPQVVVVEAAIKLYHDLGYAVEMPSITVVSDAQARAEYPDPDGDGPRLGGYQASALGGHITFTHSTVQGIRIFQRAAAKPTVRLRAAAMRSCYRRCTNAAATVLHEVAHLVQYRTGTIANPEWWIEGSAEAVSNDLYPGFIRRLTGWLPPRAYQPESTYPAEEEAYRRLHTVKWDRFVALGVVT